MYTDTALDPRTTRGPIVMVDLTRYKYCQYCGGELSISTQHGLYSRLTGVRTEISTYDCPQFDQLGLNGKHDAWWIRG